jgi:pyrroline-5-carboxylate reductase
MALMSTGGTCVECEEKLLNTVMALSGSGPVYVFFAVEAMMADGGVAAGLPRDVAIQLVAQTVMDSVKIFVETGKHHGQQTDAVCSPVGTTIAGVHALEVAGIRAAFFINAIKAAATRAGEL